MNPLSMTGVSKSYHLDSVGVVALHDISLEVLPGRFTVISGPSGSGKTTLLNLIGCIDQPDSGHISVDGQRVQDLDDDALSDFRARTIGFIFQSFNLLPVLSVAENVEYPLIWAGMAPRLRRERVQLLLESVGLADKMRCRPDQLSGGQRQRVAIARALALAPRLVLADEPTANLDSVTGEAIIELMRTMQREQNTSFIFSSHDPQVVAAADDVVTIRDGRITGIVRRGMPGEAA